MGEIVYEFYFSQAVMKIEREEKKKITAPTVTKTSSLAKGRFLACLLLLT